MKESDHYRSDEWIWALFAGWFDPCPYKDTGLNGLIIPWESKTFVNPPYSNPKPWVEKAILENQRGNTVVLLLKHDSSTEWYRMLHEHGGHFMMIHKRLYHQLPRQANFASILVVLA